MYLLSNMATLGIHVSFQGWYLSKGMGDLHYLSPIDEEATASPGRRGPIYIWVYKNKPWNIRAQNLETGVFAGILGRFFWQVIGWF